MKRKMSKKHQLMAYVLSTDADLNRDKNITQKEIGKLFNVSQSTVAQAIKETKLQMRINELEKDLSEAKNNILKMNEAKQLEIPADSIGAEYKRKP